MLRTLLVLLLSVLLLGACVKAEPLESDEVDEIPSGDGLFTGEDGEFVIFRK